MIEQIENRNGITIHKMEGIATQVRRQAMDAIKDLKFIQRELQQLRWKIVHTLYHEYKTIPDELRTGLHEAANLAHRINGIIEQWKTHSDKNDLRKIRLELELILDRTVGGRKNEPLVVWEYGDCKAKIDKLIKWVETT